MSRVVVYFVKRITGGSPNSCAARRNRAYRRSLPKNMRPGYIFALLLLPLALNACAMEGDFGRPRPTIFDRVADELLPSATTLLGSRGGSGVTDDEMAMREAGHRLSSPLNPSPQGTFGPYGSSGYGGYNTRPAARQPGHPLAAIEDELKGDHRALTRFGTASRRVLVTDSRRMQAVFEHDPILLVEDKRSSRERMKENFSFIESTFADFGRRLQAFYYAIDEKRANAPDTFTIELEGSLNHLRDRTASLEYELTHYFGAAVARGEYQPPRFASRERPRFEPPATYQRSVQPAPYDFK